MPETGARKLAEIADIRHRVRRVHWFRNSFRDAADDIGRKFHFGYAVDDRTLVDAFFRWARRFEEERVDSGRNRRDFAVYAGGLMLRELCLLNPALKTGEGQFINLIPPEPMAKICEFWPEGFLYTTFCRNLVQAILEQEFNVHPARNPALCELRIWQSFRENFRDNPSIASAFFDVFIGVEPNWSFPEHFLSRPAVSAARLKLA